MHGSFVLIAREVRVINSALDGFTSVGTTTDSLGCSEKVRRPFAGRLGRWN